MQRRGDTISQQHRDCVGVLFRTLDQLLHGRIHLRLHQKRRPRTGRLGSRTRESLMRVRCARRGCGLRVYIIALPFRAWKRSVGTISSVQASSDLSHCSTATYAD